MKTKKCLSICFAACLVTSIVSLDSQAITITYDNSNFGLIAGESQFLTVNSPSPSLLDQFNYIVTGPFDYTTATLKDGFAYNIRISGRVGLGPLDGSNNSTPDAAYRFVNWQNLDLVHVPGMDGIPWVTHWDGIEGRRPSTDVYSTAHVYDYYVEGQGAGLAFSFRDNPYYDNIGGFQVSIFELGSVTGANVPDGGSLSATFAITLLGLEWMRRQSASKSMSVSPI